jgi:hypothetical protein
MGVKQSRKAVKDFGSGFVSGWRTKESNVQSSSGIGFFGLLTILFIGLKLANFITWSWWWVLSPIWLPFALFLGVCILILVIAMIVAFFE